MPFLINRFAAFAPSQSTVNPHADTFEVPAGVAARQGLYDRFGTDKIAFADSSDPHNPKSLPMGRPGATTARPPLATGDSQEEFETQLTDTILNDETALELAKMLAGVIADYAQKALVQKQGRARTDASADQIKLVLQRLKPIMVLLQRQLNLPGAMRNANTRQSIIAQCTYIATIPALHKEFDVVLAALSRALNISYMPYAESPAGIKEAAQTARKATTLPKVKNEKIVIDLDRTPLELFNNLSWEEICTLCGFSPRDYQEEWFQRILLRAKQGFDRGYVGAPTQTGKTFASFPIAAALAAALYPQKTIVFVVKESVVKQDMIDAMKKIITTVRTNLRQMGKADLGEVKVGVIDANNKDLGAGYDLVIASLGTLCRDEHLASINPDNYGVIATDECVSLFTNQGQAVMRRFGFVDENKNITPVKDRFLFGMSADTGIYDFSRLFGQNARVDNMDLTWYIGRKNLHEPIGLDLAYKGLKDETKWTVTALGKGESEAIPADVQKAIENIYDIWVNVFHRKKIIVPWTRIAYAEAAETYFNLREQGSAYAYHSKKESAVLRRKAWVDFVEDQGVKVVHATNGLSVGARAKGVAGMIFPWQTTSLRRYGQWVGRMLGIHNDEEAAQKLIVQMTGWRGRRDETPIVTLARYLGLEGFEPIVGETYKPLVIKGGGVRKVAPPKFEAQFTGESIATPAFVEVAAGQSVVASPTRLPKIINDVLHDTFGGDLAAMAAATKFNKQDLENFMLGQLPKEYSVVKKLARAINPNLPGLVITAWLDDFLEIWQKGFALTEWPVNGAVVTLTRFLRRESLMAEFDENGAAFSSGHTITAQEAAALKKLLRGEYVDKAGNLEEPEWLPLVTGILKAQRDLDQDVVAETLAAAAEEIRVLAKERQDKEDTEAQIPDDDDTLGLANTAVRATTGLEAISPQDLFPNDGEISVGRKALLYSRLGRRLFNLFRYATVEALRKELKLYYAGDYLIQKPETLDGLETFRIPRRRERLQSDLAMLGLSEGMNVRGWQDKTSQLSITEIDALFALFDKPVAELDLGDEITAKLHDVKIKYIGQLWDQYGGYGSVWEESANRTWRESLSTNEVRLLEETLWNKFELSFEIKLNGWVNKLLLGDTLSRRVDELAFSVKTANCLQNAKIEFIWQLVEQTEARLLKIKNFGRSSLNEVKEVLSELGLQLGMDENVFRGLMGVELIETRPAPESQTALWTMFDEHLSQDLLGNNLSSNLRTIYQKFKISFWGNLPVYVGNLLARLDLSDDQINTDTSYKHRRPWARGVRDQLIQKNLMNPDGTPLDPTWERPEKRAVKRFLAAHANGEAPDPQDKAILNFLLSTRVDELEFSIRAANLIQNNGIETVRELVARTELDYLRSKFGRKSIGEIEDALAEVGLSLGMPELIWALGNMQNALNGRTNKLQLSDRSARVLSDNGIEFVWQLARLTDAEILQLKNCNRIILSELIKALQDLRLERGTMIVIPAVGGDVRPMTPDEIHEAKTNGLDLAMNINLQGHLHDCESEFSFTNLQLIESLGLFTIAGLAEKTEDELTRALRDREPNITIQKINRTLNEIKKALLIRGLSLGTKIHPDVSRGERWRTGRGHNLP